MLNGLCFRGSFSFRGPLRGPSHARSFASSALFALIVVTVAYNGVMVYIFGKDT